MHVDRVAARSPEPGPVPGHRAGLRQGAQGNPCLGHAQRHAEENPREGMPAVPKPRGTGECVTFTQADVKAKLIPAGDKGHRNRLRNTVIDATLLDTGIRAGELTSLSRPSIQSMEHSFRVCGESGEREASALTCLRHPRRYVEQERKLRPGETATSTSRVSTRMKPSAVAHVVGTIAAEAEVGATRTGLHTSRHTFAVEYVRNGGGVSALARILGHSEPEPE